MKPITKFFGNPLRMSCQKRRQNLRQCCSQSKHDDQHAHDPSGQACEAMRYALPSFAHRKPASKQYDIELFLRVMLLRLEAYAFGDELFQFGNRRGLLFKDAIYHFWARHH